MIGTVGAWRVLLTLVIATILTSATISVSAQTSPAVEIDISSIGGVVRGPGGKTAFLVSQAAVPALVETPGVIVNFASVPFFRPQDEMAVYAAAKAGVAAFTQSLALELRDRGVRVNAVAPGMVRTGDNVSAAPGGKVRWVEMRQITDGVLFLASDAADAITGHVLPITNGAL